MKNLGLASLVFACCACGALKSGGPSPDDKAALLDADRAFAHEVQLHGLEAWVAAFDVNGSQVDQDFRPITGRDAISANMRGFFADGLSKLSWQPDTATLSEAGHMGSTSGRFELSRESSAGTREVVLTGRYFDVWRKLPDGTWKLLYDIGDADEPRTPNK